MEAVDSGHSSDWLLSCDVTRSPLQTVEIVTICSQSGLLQPSGLSADLDVLNELSRDLSPGDPAARRLQRLNRCWATAAARAEEACRSEKPHY